MELLIPGLILVALMVYASTRIKKTAAQAFEPETIETDAFTIEKPEGFLSVINGNPELEFEAYSREFGGEGAEDVKQARAEVRCYDGTNLTAAVRRIEEKSKVVSNVAEIIGERKYRLIEAEKTEKDVGLLEFYKIAETASGVRELKIIALDETNADVARKIETMISSFTVK
jgi:hypothetical protein